MAGLRRHADPGGLALQRSIICSAETVSVGTSRRVARLVRNFWFKKAGAMIRKLRSGEYRLYSRKANPKTGKRRNLGTFKSRAAAEKHERAVQYFKRH